MRLFVTVKTAAREEKVEEKDATHFAVSVKAQPIDGKANVAVAKALARHLGVAPSRLSLRSGATSKSKVFVLE
ncbi:MAG: DUF167 domain-containing protein [Candidatus Moraniibacteriota bacterium]